MQCLQCQAENRADRRFCAKCGAVLSAACPDCGFANEPSDEFCGGCGVRLSADGPRDQAERRPPKSNIPIHLAERILSARGTLEGERKQVTVLFADVVESTMLTREMDPEQAANLLEPALGTMMDAVHRYEGTVNKVQGDGIMALFGAPLAHEDHAVRACYAALAMQRAIGDQAAATRGFHGAEVQIRVGLHSGEVLVRAIGNDLSMDYDAIGPTVHLASRMEQIATAGGTRLTADTLRLVEGFVDLRPLGPVPVKGIAEPVEVFELIGVGAAHTRLQAAVARGLTRFVGRQDEIETLNRCLSLAGEGHGQIIAAVGEPGVGKSRLYYEFIHSHRTDGWLVLESSSVSFGKATAWAPVTDLLRSYFRIETSDDNRIIREKIIGKILALDEALKAIVPAIVSLFEATGDEHEWQALDPIKRRQTILDGVKALLLREGEIQPLIVVFEDLHWADSESLALLDGLVESLPTARILLLVNFRPEFTHEWAGRAHYAQVRLNPLAEQGADELLATLLGKDEGLASLRRLLIERAEGNPLFLEESVRTLAETGVLGGATGAYVLVGDPSAVEMPASVQAIIAARIDRLGPEDKRLLQTAAVVGHDVAHTLLQSVADMPEDKLRHSLANLQSAEFLYEARLFPDLEYSFKHAFTYEVAYGGLLESQRRRLHARVGETIEELYPDRHSEMADELANHFAKGEVWDKAADYYIRAAAKARVRYTYPVAVELCRKAVDCTERTGGVDADRRRGLAMLGDLWGLLGDLDQANSAYESALEIEVGSCDRAEIANKVHRRHFVERDGARIAYYEHGSGDETIVAISPLFYEVTMFQPLLEGLCQEFKVVTFHPRGDGASDPAPSPYTADEQVEDIRAVVKALDHGPKTAVGISLGAILSVKLACLEPSLFSRIVLVDSPLDDAMPGSRFPRPNRLSERVASAVESGDLDGAVRMFFHSVYSDPGWYDFAEREARMFCEGASPDELRRIVMAFHTTDPSKDISGLLDQVSVPALVTHGSEDQRIPIAAGRYIAEHIPDSIFYPFEGAGHLPIYTATAEFIDVLRTFIRTGTVPETSKGHD
ncbi:MAG: alpha/beta fold hydrolase [Planctomycetota bacterium]|nr:alpha/beta fold hydrolase [Planctomycetota bacterium]